MDKVIFIDRDGVINVDLMGYVEHPEDFEFEKNAINALRMLHEEDYKIIVISNQAGIGDGVFTEEQLWEVHERMVGELRGEGIEIFDTQYCFDSKHAKNSTHRKPATGMFEDSISDLGLKIDKSKTYFIGDKATDVQAGKNFGLKTAFVRTGHGEKDESKLSGKLTPDLTADNLYEAVKMILSSD